jgi:hypothetical protein
MKKIIKNYKENKDAGCGKYSTNKETRLDLSRVGRGTTTRMGLG